MDFSEFLRHTRYFYGLTLREFGDRVNFSVGYISDVERQRKNASDKFKAAVLREFPRTDAFDRFLMEIKRGDIEEKERAANDRRIMATDRNRLHAICRYDT